MSVIGDGPFEISAAAVAAQWSDWGARRAASELRVFVVPRTTDRVDLERVTNLAVDELTARAQQVTRWPRLGRNTAVAALLLFTLATVAVAVQFYQYYVAAHPAAQNSSFILLWEQRFGGRAIPTATEVIYVDILFIVSFVALSARVNAIMRSAARRSIEAKAQGTELAWTIERNRISPPSTPEEWARSAALAITEGMAQNRMLIRASERAIEDAVSKLTATQIHEREFLSRFSNEITETLSAARADNADFLTSTVRENREFLRVIAEELRNGGQPDVDVSTYEVSIYLSDGEHHEQVEDAVEALVVQGGLRIETREDPVEGSWFRRMKAVFATPVGRESSLIAAHIAGTKLWLAQDATMTSALAQSVSTVLTALQPTRDAVVRLGAVLIVKVDWAVTVHQLTAAQQAVLDLRPELTAAPHQIMEALRLPPADGAGDTLPMQQRKALL